MFKTLSSLNHLDVISKAISAQFHCDVVMLKPNSTKEIIKGRYTSCSEELPLYYGFDEIDGQFYHISFPKENIDKYNHVTNLVIKECKYGGLGCLHLDMPYSGPTRFTNLFPQI